MGTWVKREREREIYRSGIFRGIRRERGGLVVGVVIDGLWREIGIY